MVTRVCLLEDQTYPDWNATHGHSRIMHTMMHMHEGYGDRMIAPKHCDSFVQWGVVPGTYL